MDDVWSIRGDLKGNAGARGVADEVRAADAEMAHQAGEPGRLLSKSERPRQWAAAGIARPVITKQPEASRERRLFKQRIEPVGTGTVVHQYDVFAGAAHLVFQLDPAERCPIHLLHFSTGRSGAHARRFNAFCVAPASFRASLGTRFRSRALARGSGATATGMCVRHTRVTEQVLPAYGAQDEIREPLHPPVLDGAAVLRRRLPLERTDNPASPEPLLWCAVPPEIGRLGWEAT